MYEEWQNKFERFASAGATILDKIMRTYCKFSTKSDILRHTESSMEVQKLFEMEKQLEDWALGCHPTRNGHVTC